MRIRTLFAITLTMIALPAIATEVPTMPVPRELPAPPAVETNPNLSVSFEVRLLKAPVGFCERAGVKLTGDAVLADKDVFRLLEAVQGERTANVMQLPKITADDGQTATVRNCEERSFTTGGEMVKVQGQSVFVPKNKSIELGSTFTVSGHVSADERTVNVRASLTLTALGNVELIPIVTPVTPVFEGGSQGQPVPVTQFLQVPNVKTEKVEKSAIVPAGGTIVLGSWREAGERPARKALFKKEKTVAEYEFAVLVTARAFRNEEPAVSVAPAPRALPERVTKVFSVADLVIPNKPGQNAEEANTAFRRNVDNVVKAVTGQVRPDSWDRNGGRGRVEHFEIGCALVVTNTPDVVNDVGELLNRMRWLQEQAARAEPAGDKPAPDKGTVYKLRNAAAADAAQAVSTHLQNQKSLAHQKAVVIAEPVSNTVLVSAEPAVQEQILTLLTALDKAPPQVMLQAMVVQVPRGFAARAGLIDESAANGTAVTLSPREMKMFAGLIRGAKERNECDILSQPQVLVNDNQCGSVRVGQEFSVRTLGLVKSDSGTVIESKIEYVPTGFSMRFTPRVAPDGKAVLMTAELENTTVSSTLLTTGSPGSESTARVPVFNTESVRAVSEIRSGQSMLVVMARDTGGSFTGTIRRLLNRDRDETLVVITPHLLTSPEPIREASEVRK